MDKIAMWCGYAVMVVTSALLSFGGLFFLVALCLENYGNAVKLYRDTYWFMVFRRVQRRMKAKKHG